MKINTNLWADRFSEDGVIWSMESYGVSENGVTETASENLRSIIITHFSPFASLGYKDEWSIFFASPNSHVELGKIDNTKHTTAQCGKCPVLFRKTKSCGTILGHLPFSFCKFASLSGYFKCISSLKINFVEVKLYKINTLLKEVKNM